MVREKRTMGGDLRCGLFKELSSVVAPGKLLGRPASLYLYGHFLHIDIWRISRNITLGSISHLQLSKRKRMEHFVL